MREDIELQLPASGLAEEVLGRFMEDAQNELDNVPEHQGRRKAETFFHLVTFNLLKEEFGVEISTVQEIIRATDITPVPGAPSHVRGVINLRGKIIPVVDLRRRFSLPEVDISDNQRIVVVELGPKRIGMLVDSVSQVIKVPVGVVEEMPDEAINVDENYIKGVGKLDSRLIIMLDLNRSLLFL
jgi:purine-binding chemotaxis protein CheW